jgi:signal transduction histidine kinase
MTRTSLHLRLLGGAAVAIFMALALAGFGISWLFHQHVERREAADLVKLGEQVVAGLTLDRVNKPFVEPPPPDPGFRSIAGGIYWQAIAPGGTAQSPSLWDQSLPRSPSGTRAWSSSTIMGPFNRQLTMVSRRVQPDVGPTRVIVRVAKDDDEMRDALREFDQELALSLGLLWLVLSLAAYAQVRLGLRPLLRLREELDRLRRSPSARLSDQHPQEILPLTRAINALADAREADLARARRRAADLAHSLKTPLAVLSAQSRRARESGSEVEAGGIGRAIDAMGAALEAELARARATAARGTGGQSVPHDIVEGLVAVVERTEHGENIAFSTDVSPDLRTPIDGSDLAEMLGALIENAARHARRHVRISSLTDTPNPILRVEDDGPGMDADAIAKATERGVRIDESGAGHGLGLAIVRDLAEATEMDFRLGRSPLGGLLAELGWRGPEGSPPNSR